MKLLFVCVFVCILSTVSKAARVSIPLFAAHERLLWGGKIAVGDPPQNFRVQFDTGSTDLFIFDTQCGEPCNGRSLYDPTASSTSVDTGEDFKHEYFSNSVAEGIIYNDTVTIDTIQAMEQAVGGATSFTGPFDTFNFPLDGVIGLGLPEISSFKKRTFIHTLIDQGAIDHPVFAFKFTDTAGELDIGAVNADLYTGDFAIADVTQPGHWQIKMDSFTINGQEVGANLEAIIDTGSPLIYISPDLAKAFHDQIPGSAIDPDAGEGQYRFPCNSQIDITLTFAGTAFPLSVASFNRGLVSEGSADCLSGVVGSGSDSIALIGTVFLENVYTTFSLNPLYIGFAKLA